MQLQAEYVTIRDEDGPHPSQRRRRDSRMFRQVWLFTLFAFLLIVSIYFMLVYVAHDRDVVFPVDTARPSFSQHRNWYSGEDSPRPFASRSETTITLQPSGVSFAVDRDWVDWHDQFHNNLHLTHDQLDAVAKGEGEWDTEFASVCNAIFPFDRCSAHVGGEGWGKDAVSFGDLQVRVYDLAEPIEELKTRITDKGTKEVERITGDVADLKHDTTQEWHQSVFTYDRFYYDYGGKAHIDMRLRRIGDRSIVFVFMYTAGWRNADSITTILNSVSRAGT